MLFPLWVLTTVSSVALSLASGDAWPFAVTPALAAATLAWSGVDDRRGLGPWSTAVLGLVALGWTLYEYRYGGSTNPLRITHVLAFATWVATVRRGTRGKVWLLLVLSVFHLAAVALSEESFWLPLALPFCLAASLTVLVQLVGAAVGRERSVGAGDVRVVTDTAEPPFASSYTWLAAGTVASLVVGFVTFTLVPRTLQGEELAFLLGDTPPVVERRVTGYTDHVRLGEPGRIERSDAPAMQVRFTNEATGEPVDVAEFFADRGFRTPYFRGSIAVGYENGNWVPEQSVARFGSINSGWRMVGLPELPSAEPVLRQEYRLERAGPGTLFVAPGTVGCRCDDSRFGVLLHDELDTWTIYPRDRPFRWRQKLRLQPLEYTAYSVVESSDEPASRRQRFLALPVAGLPRLERLAREQASRADERVDGETSRERRLVDEILSDLLRGGYVYRLETRRAPRGVDPIEDFLFDSKVGFCEHFATAMTLLLRANGVPARLVSGYKGGSTDPETGDHVLVETDAHAWVEAYVDGDWQTFDPTPGASGGSNDLDPDDDVRNVFGAQRTIVTRLWNEGVVQYGSGRSSKVVRETASGLGAAASRVGASFVAVVGSGSTAVRSAGSVGTTLGVAMLFAGVAWLVVRRRSTPESRSVRAESRAARLFARLERWAAGCGVERRVSETHREFADRVSRQLRHHLETSDCGDLPGRVVDHLYSVRFGRAAADAGSEGLFATALTRVERV